MKYQSIREKLFAPVDIASLAYFRIAFGAIMLWEVWRYFDHGWIARYWIAPDFHFKYFGFGWVHPWPGIGMYIHFIVMGILAVLMMVGLYYRLSAILFFLGFTYVFLLDQMTYLNHFYLISLISFLMIFVPAHRAFSLDVKWRNITSLQTAPAWMLWILRFQIGAAYFFGGIAKLNRDWLRCEPFRTWLSWRTDFPLLGEFFTDEWMVYCMNYGGMLFDLLVVPFLLWKRTRIPAFLVAVLFHLMNARMFSIGIFPWFMIAATAIFFDPSWPRNFFGRSKGAKTLADDSLITPQRSQRWLIIGMIIYISVQLLVPLRHFLYPGYVSWTEEGHRFAWHMKLRDKDADVSFLLANPKTGEQWYVHPHEYLSNRQVDEMPSRPDMILQFAHYLEGIYQKKGIRDISVKARARASLNGRPEQWLLDPDIDLTQVNRTLAPADWIVPLKVPYPPAP